MIIDYLSLKSITCIHSEEIHTAVSNVIDRVGIYRARQLLILSNNTPIT